MAKGPVKVAGHSVAGDFFLAAMGVAPGVDILAQLFNSGVRAEKQTARKLVNLRAVRWTVWD
jgi:hypothetical protein